MLGHDESLAYQPWVKYDETLCVDDTITMGVQVNGKTRGDITIAKDADQGTAMQMAKENARIQRFLEGKEIKKVIFVPGRILNVIVK